MPLDFRSLERLPLLAGFVRAHDARLPSTPQAAQVHAARWFRGAWELRVQVTALPDVAARRAYEARSSLAVSVSSPNRIVVDHPIRMGQTPPAFVRVAAGTVLIEVSGYVHEEMIHRGQARASSAPSPERMDAAVLALAQALARQVSR